jgi:hypothetical protein
MTRAGLRAYKSYKIDFSTKPSTYKLLFCRVSRREYLSVPVIYLRTAWRIRLRNVNNINRAM